MLRRLLARWRFWRHTRRIQRALSFAQHTPASDRLRPSYFDGSDLWRHFARRGY